MGERLIAIARGAVEAHLAGERFEAPRLPAPWDGPRAVFVTLRTAEGALRGCIGHLKPVHPHVGVEVAHVAVSAACRDPRFPPVDTSELPELRWSISVLQPAERVTDLTTLDPRRFGVIVSAGRRRGVLLPDIDGVDSVAEQLAICRRKAGIPHDAEVAVERFEVSKIGA